MKVLQPSNNKINGGYTSSHKAYDHDDSPDNRVFASFDGEVTRVVDKYDSSWLQGKEGDPTPGSLTTEDYGNFVMIKGTELTQLTAHLKKGAVIKVGQKVKKGDVIGYAGDNSTDTGNSTGGHIHTEYRLSNGNNTQVEFIKGEQPMPEKYDFKGLDYSNKASMAEAVRVWAEVRDGKYMTVEAHNRSVAQYVTQINKAKDITNELSRLSEVTVSEPEQVSKALEAYNKKQLVIEEKAKELEAPTKAKEELLKEAGRIGLLAVYAMPITTGLVALWNALAKQNELPEASVVDVMPIVTAVLRVIDRAIHVYGLSSNSDGLKTGITRF